MTAQHTRAGASSRAVRAARGFARSTVRRHGASRGSPHVAARQQPPGAARHAAGGPAVRLSVVPSVASPAPRTPFVLLILVLVAAGLVGLLLLNTAINENVFRLHDLQKEKEALDLREQQLDRDIERAGGAGHPAGSSAAARARAGGQPGLHLPAQRPGGGRSDAGPCRGTSAVGGAEEVSTAGGDQAGCDHAWDDAACDDQVRGGQAWGGQAWGDQDRGS